MSFDCIPSIQTCFTTAPSKGPGPQKVKHHKQEINTYSYTSVMCVITYFHTFQNPYSSSPHIKLSLWLHVKERGSLDTINSVHQLQFENKRLNSWLRKCIMMFYFYVWIQCVTFKWCMHVNVLLLISNILFLCNDSFQLSLLLQMPM